VPLSTGGSFSLTTQLALDGTPDGVHVEHLKATDQAGNVRTFDQAFTLDTVPPVINVDTPSANAVVNQNPTITGQVTDVTSGAADLQAAVDSGPFTDVSLDANGNFSFATTLAADGTADGPHVEHLKATDKAGNIQTFDLHFTLAIVPPVITVTIPHAIQADATDPLFASRGLAMVQAAVFDAVSAIEGSCARPPTCTSRRHRWSLSRGSTSANAA
jgi:hypothetical protein